MKTVTRSYTLLKITPSHPYYNWCKSACLESRYLYNTMLYQYRNSYFNADINGSLNILRKVVKNDYMSDLIESQQWAMQSPISITL